jgi:hypothetical protein
LTLCVLKGGLGGEPGNEAHGGYTYCGVATLVLLGRSDTLNVPALAAWAGQRQNAFCGGFDGRTNKLADGCYSFWQGALFPLLATAATPSLISTPHLASAATGSSARELQVELPELPDWLASDDGTASAGSDPASASSAAGHVRFFASP